MLLLIAGTVGSAFGQTLPGTPSVTAQVVCYGESLT